MLSLQEIRELRQQLVCVGVLKRKTVGQKGSGTSRRIFPLKHTGGRFETKTTSLHHYPSGNNRKNDPMRR